MNRWRLVRLIAAKDLRVERRSRVLISQVVPFAGVLMIVFAFGLDAKATRVESAEGAITSPVLQLAAPGLVWLAAMFSVLVLVQRAYAVETADGALDALRVAGVDPAALFWGKSIALAVELLIIEAVVIAAAVLLYNLSIPIAGLPMLVLTCLLATGGLAFVGTLYGGLTAGATGRDTLLPLLVLPVVAPVLIGATRAVESAFGTDGVALEEGWPWLGLLTVFAIAYGAGGALAFGPLIEEAK